MTKFLAVTSMTVALCLIAGCDSTDTRQSRAQEAILDEADRQVGLPRLANFTEKKLVAQLYELRDQSSLPTYTYIVDMNGNLHFLCRSIGFGIPYGTQFSNPMKRLGMADLTLPQAEPNGLFMPDAADATWVFMATKDGPKPLYVEPTIIASPVPLESVDGPKVEAKTAAAGGPTRVQ